MQAKLFAIGLAQEDRFGEYIRRIVDGGRDWPAAKGQDAAEIAAERRGFAHELLTGYELVDLVGHSTPIKCCLKLGDWVLDRVAAEQLASYLPDSVQVVRLIGCSTASTEEGCAAAISFTREHRSAYGTLNKVYATHFDKGGVKDGIGAPPMRGFFPADRTHESPVSTSSPSERQAKGFLGWLVRGPWRALRGIFRGIRRLLPWRADPWSRISGLLHPGATAMPGLLTEPLMIFGIASGSTTWRLEILFDFECARLYATGGAAGDRDFVYRIRGFGMAAKTPLEAYLERAPRGVTLLSRHEEAGNRCEGVPRPGDPTSGVARIVSLVVLVAVIVALALLGDHMLVHEVPTPARDTMSVDGGHAPIDAPVDAPIDAALTSRPPPDVGGVSHPPVESPIHRPPVGCLAQAPARTYAGHVDEYVSPETYGDATCRQSLSLQIDDYSSSYLGAADRGGTFVSWAGVSLTTRTACEDAWIQADLYRDLAGQWTLVSSTQDHGAWTKLFDVWSCAQPAIGWRNKDGAEVWIAHASYRIVATARTSRTGNTQKFRVSSEKDGWLK